MSRSSARSAALLLAAAVWGAWVCAHSFTRSGAFPPAFIDAPIHGLPHAAAAAWRAACALGGASLVATAVWNLGRWLTLKAGELFADSPERLLVIAAVGATALSGVLSAMGLLHLYRPAAVTALIILLAASRPRTWIVGWRTLRDSWRRTTHRQVRMSDAGYALCAAVGLACAAVGALAPEIEYDALWYHLWLPVRALHAGAPVDIVEEYVSLYPLGWELLNGGALAVGGPVAAKLLHFACLPLLAGSACLLARRLAPHVSRPLVFALVVCTPTVLWEASTAYVDLALAWLATVAVCSLLRWHDTSDRRWLVIAGVVLGGALAVKHLALVVLLVCAVAAAVVRTGSVAAGWSRRHRIAAGLRAAVLLVAIALSLASPWYARAWAASRNPVFPELFRVFGAAPAERWSDEVESNLSRFEAGFGMGRTPGAILLLPWNVTAHGARFAGAVGPLFLALVPFALLMRQRRGGKVIALGCLVYVLVWASPLGSFQMRFLLPIVPFLAVGAAAGVSVLTWHAGRVRSWLANAPRAAVTVLLVLNLPFFTEYQERDRRGWTGWITHVLRALPLGVVVGAESEDAYLARTVPTYRAWQFIDASTPPGSRVLTFAGGDHLYSHRPRLWADATMAYPATWHAAAGEEARMLRELQRLGITHVLLDRGQMDRTGVSRLALVSAVTLQCCLEPIYEDERVSVYRVSRY